MHPFSDITMTYWSISGIDTYGALLLSNVSDLLLTTGPALTSLCFVDASIGTPLWGYGPALAV
jgi:hypothetical protein